MPIKPTAEQEAIIEASRSGATVAISAGVGTGKTSTLRLIAEANPDKSMLYLGREVTDDRVWRGPDSVWRGKREGIRIPAAPGSPPGCAAGRSRRG